MATRSCAECLVWQFHDTDDQNGAWKKGDKALRGGKPIKRSLPPNCGACPKKSPQQAHLYELSDRNKKAIEFYFTTRAMSGVNLTDELRQDAIVQRNMAIIDRIMRPYEAEQSALVAMAPVLSSMAAAPRPKREGRK